MKSIKNSLIVVLLLVFVGNANGIAQSSIDVEGVKNTHKELRDEVSKKKEEAQKVKNNAESTTSDASSVSQVSSDEITKIKEKLKKTTNKAERKELMAEIKRLRGGDLDSDDDGVNDKVGDVKDGRSKPNEVMSDEMRKYKEKMKDATPEERKELETKMREMRKERYEAKDLVKEEAKEVKENVAAKKVKKYSDLKGRELGNARATEAKKMIEKREADMANRDRFVASGRDRVATAKAKVQSDLDSGKINKEQAAEKLAKIANVEQRLKDYKARLKNGKKKLTNHKNLVSGYIKN